MIEVRGLSRFFGRKKEIHAVREVSFVAPDGHITGLLGPNGAGKTTLLRMLATLLPPDAGEASIDGHDTQRDKMQVCRAIGVLSDARGLYPRLTARENIRYYGALHGLNGAALEARVATVLNQVGLSEIAERRTHGFSHGEKMKVAIARALVHDPHTVLLDEPTNGLDVMATRAMRELIRGLRTTGKCVVFSSHIMQEVAALCDRIIIISSGRIIAEGTPDFILRASGQSSLEEAFVALLGSEAGLLA